MAIAGRVRAFVDHKDFVASLGKSSSQDGARKARAYDTISHASVSPIRFYLSPT
jgi:hypothetical protein